MKSPMHRKRETPYLSRSAQHPSIAYIILPQSIAPVDMTAMIFQGNGKLGIQLLPDGGEFIVRRSSKRASTRRLNIPKGMADMFPVGTHDISLRPVGSLLVVEITS
jgi:hypothetical protein